MFCWDDVSIETLWEVLEMFHSENTVDFKSFLLAFNHVNLQVLLRRARTNMLHRVEYKQPKNVFSGVTDCYVVYAVRTGRHKRRSLSISFRKLIEHKTYCILRA